MIVDTGFLQADVANDFLRMQRRQRWSQLLRWLRRVPGHESELLVFDDVMADLERTGERDLGLRTIELTTIMGTVGRLGDFDRWFRPRRPVSRQRWESLDRASRAGVIIAPIDVYRVGSLHFVRDGHHRVSVAHALGLQSIDAFVTEVTTSSPVETLTWKGRGRRRRSA